MNAAARNWGWKRCGPGTWMWMIAGQPPLRPFKDVEELKAHCSAIFQQVDPALGDRF